MNGTERARELLKRPGRVHFIGIGGVGMAGVARLLLDRGFRVSGCDLQPGRFARPLSKLGAEIFTGHDEDHILGGGVDWVVRTTAVPPDHPEVRAALSLGLPVIRRGELLPALISDRRSIAVAGAHGKTTTAALIAQVLECGYCIGGEIRGAEAVARDGDPLVAEADESDGTLAFYAPDLAVLTNIDFDHLEHHGSEEAFLACFERFIEQSGRVFYRADDPLSARLCAGRANCEPFALPGRPFELPLPGEHNQWNAAAALAVCRLFLPEEEVRRRLAKARPVRRRFETVFDRDDIRVISDYAHHPTEITALVRAARDLRPARVLAIFQPHRYTRTRALGKAFPPAFAGVDRLWLTPVYAASEPPLPGGTTEDLFRKFPAEEWTGRLRLSPSLEAAWEEALCELRPGDLLLLVGAGDIERLGDAAREM